MGTSVEKLALSRAWDRYRGVSRLGLDGADGPEKAQVASSRLGSTALSAALLSLGVRCVMSRSFIPAWQPTPKSLPLPDLWATLNGVLLAALALMVLVGWRRKIAAYALAMLLAAWIVVLQMPGILAAPGAVLTWLGVAEVGALASAAALVGLGASREPRSDGWRNGALARGAFGLCAIIFGLSHFAYADFTAGMIPAWLPARLFLAYATGTAHIAVGVAIATGVCGRLAAMMLTLMTASFVVLVHLPAVVASGGSLAEVTFLLNACAICGAAWTVAESMSPGHGRRLN